MNSRKKRSFRGGVPFHLRESRGGVLPLLIVFILLAHSFPSKGSTASFSGSESFSRRPLDIDADRMEALAEGHRLLFYGNVEVRGGETRLFADEVEARIDPEGEVIRQLTAKGNVKLQQEGRVAYSEEALFEGGSNQIILFGHPELWWGESFIRGERIVVLLDENHVRVEKARGSIDASTFEKGE